MPPSVFLLGCDRLSQSESKGLKLLSFKKGGGGLFKSPMDFGLKGLGYLRCKVQKGQIISVVIYLWSFIPF